MRLRCRLRSSVSLLAQTKYRVAYVELVSKIMRSDYFKCGNFVYHFCLETGSHRFVQNFSANAQDKFGEFSLRKCLAGFAEGRNLIAQDSIGDRPHRFGRRISHALKKLPRDRRLFSGDPGKPYAVRRPKTNDYSFTSIALARLDTACFIAFSVGPRSRSFGPGQANLGRSDLRSFASLPQKEIAGCSHEHIRRDFLSVYRTGHRQCRIAENIDRAGPSLGIMPDGLDDLLGENLWTVITRDLETVTNILVYLGCRSQKAQTVMNRDPLLDL